MKKVKDSTGESERDTFKVEIVGPNEISLGNTLSDESFFLRRVSEPYQMCLFK